ncbi:MAG: peptidoglycan-binding domain-containing protein [Pyrinomonadaceae bacterium]
MLTQGSRGNDVAKLQTDLNKAYPRDLPQLRPDGVFGPKTREWVIRFQRNNPPLKPDGIVGPKTLAKLATLASTPGVPPPIGGITIPPSPANPGAGILNYRAVMEQEFQNKGLAPQFGEFLTDLENNTIPGWKNFLGGLSRTEDARQLAGFWIELFRITKGARSQMPAAFAAVVKLDKNALELFEALSAPTSKLGSAMKTAGSAANAIGLLVTVVECVQHARRGEPGPIAAELYKFAMGKAVPWAGMIDGLGQLVDGIAPGSAKNSAAFKLLRSVDPVGLGGVAVDSLASIITSGAEMAAAGRVDVDILTRRLTPLVARMKQGPANLFVELGENSGDALYELTQTDIDFNAMLRYSFMELEEWFEKAGSGGSAVGGVRHGTI